MEEKAAAPMSQPRMDAGLFSCWVGRGEIFEDDVFCYRRHVILACFILLDLAALTSNKEIDAWQCVAIHQIHLHQL